MAPFRYTYEAEQQRRMLNDETSQFCLNRSVTSYLHGNTSLMYIRPVFKLRWKRPGVRLLKQATWDKNMLAAVCKAKCLRISHNDEASLKVRTMYYKRDMSFCAASTMKRHSRLSRRSRVQTSG